MKNRFRIPFEELPAFKHWFEDTPMYDGDVERYYGTYTDNVWMLNERGWKWTCFYSPCDGYDAAPQTDNFNCYVWMYGRKKNKPTEQDRLDALHYALEYAERNECKRPMVGSCFFRKDKLEKERESAPDETTILID